MESSVSSSLISGAVWQLTALIAALSAVSRRQNLGRFLRTPPGISFLPLKHRNRLRRNSARAGRSTGTRQRRSDNFVR